MTARPDVGRLHVLTDEELQTRFTHLELAQLAAEGGADVVQYRDKRLQTTQHLVETARAMRGVLSPGMRLVVNDRADVALASGAGGVHLGRDDVAPAVARGILGPETLIGGTVHSLEEMRLLLRSAAGRDLDYFGVGPVFGTRSKANPAPALGLERLGEMARLSPLPVIAIGNILPEQVGDVLAAGAHGIAVLSGVALAADPRQATARYREALQHCPSERSR